MKGTYIDEIRAFQSERSPLMDGKCSNLAAFKFIDAPEPAACTSSCTAQLVLATVCQHAHAHMRE